MQMAKIVLHGNLQKYGDSFEIAAYNAIDAVRCLCSQLKGFRKDFTQGSYRFLRKSFTNEEELSVETLRLKLHDKAELHIMPVAAGAKSGTGKIILGAVIVAAAFIMAPEVATVALAGQSTTAAAVTASMGATAFLGITYAQIAGFGLALMLGGVTQMLTSKTASSASTSVDANASFLFNGPTNTGIQGSARPLLYGKFCCGSIVASSALAVEEYNAE